MASVSGFAYQRLRDEGVVFDEEIEQNKAIILKKLRGWLLRKRVRLTGRRRPRVRIFGLISMRLLRKRARVFKRIKVSWVKLALRRLKSGKALAHWNDLFGGNYLFMQPNPIPFKCGERPYNIGHGLHGNLPFSTYSLGRIA